MSFPLQILAPTATLFVGEVDELIAPSAVGEVDILPNHADYLTLLGPGTIRVRQGNTPAQSFETTGGVLSINQNKALVLLDAAGLEKQDALPN